jgi:hypothetical protein
LKALRRTAAVCALLLLSACAGGFKSANLGSSYYEQTYLPKSYNFALRARYASVDGLLNAFDYGHAVLYETLWRKPNAPATALDRDQFDFITTQLLRHPPDVPLDESAIGPNWTRLAPEVAMMFDWAHMLHRQLYDIWSADDVPLAEKDAKVRAAIRYYRSRPELALSSRPKSMSLMEGQPYSLAFRNRYPKYNGLIWSYHWLQMALYDALMVTPAGARSQSVRQVVDAFWQMIGSGGALLPSTMPQSAAVAPCFGARYPEASIIFDNLHSLHDVVSDILANPSIARAKKRATILDAAARYRDSTTLVTTVEDWRKMSLEMGTAKMGGVGPAGGACEKLLPY